VNALRRSVGGVGSSLIVITMWATGCGQAENTRPALPEVSLIGTSEPVPYSENHSIALVDTDRVCMIHSYETQVVCGDRSWNETVTLGQDGEGPGEFRSPLHVLRGPDRAVGVFDGALARVTVFDPDGRVLLTSPTPFLLDPVAAFDSTVTGRYARTGLGESIAGVPVATVHLRRQEIVWDTDLSHPSEVGMRTVSERGLAGGARSSSGGITFLTGNHDFVDYTEDGQVLRTFPAEGYREEYPGPRDIEEYRSRQFLGSTPGEGEVRRYSEEPKRYMHLGNQMRYDDEDRLWLLTLRDRDASSYLDVYQDQEWLGSVEVRDRAYGFDLLGNLLVVLVERAEFDAEGLAVRAIDWYEVHPP
jgi:hypothetical protein